MRCMTSWSPCSESGCERPVEVRGWCRTHYVAARRRGLPALTKPTDEERFHSGVEMGGPDECWEWRRGFRAGFGKYGIIRWHGRMVGAHRVAWMLANGRDPGELCVLHRCDNPPCCNPAHLWLGDQKANNDDKEAKGRAAHPRGEEHGAAILNERQVREIRERYARGDVTQPVLAVEYGVSTQAISAVVTRVSWAYVP